MHAQERNNTVRTKITLNTDLGPSSRASRCVRRSCFAWMQWPSLHDYGMLNGKISSLRLCNRHRQTETPGTSVASESLQQRTHGARGLSACSRGFGIAQSPKPRTECIWGARAFKKSTGGSYSTPFRKLSKLVNRCPRRGNCLNTRAAVPSVLCTSSNHPWAHPLLLKSTVRAATTQSFGVHPDNPARRTS